MKSSNSIFTLSVILDSSKVHVLLDVFDKASFPYFAENYVFNFSHLRNANLRLSQNRARPRFILLLLVGTTYLGELVIRE